jgi:hypothetical protein
MNDDRKQARRPVNADINITIDDNDKIEEVTKSTFNPHKIHKKIKNKHPLTKKEKWVVFTEVVIIVIGLCAIAYVFARAHKTYEATHNNNITSKKPTQTISKLTGLPVTAAEENLPVTAVMIENSDQARPQSGLSQAGVVFEALAEGGITRFVAIYQSDLTSSIGPVRSARPYFIDWMYPFDAGYAHVGGSPTALSLIQTLNVRDMNQFSNGSYFTRISSRQAPHNVYTSTSSLYSLEQAKGWTSSSFVGFPRKADSPSKNPTATTINLNPSYSDMAVNYQYDATQNSYKRSEGGSPMLDADTGQQIEPKVVIAMVVPWTNGALDSSNAYYTVYSDIGSGTAYVFQDGTVTQGTWAKPSVGTQITFTNANGSPIKLNAGQTWITALGANSEISYSK